LDCNFIGLGPIRMIIFYVILPFLIILFLHYFRIDIKRDVKPSIRRFIVCHFRYIDIINAGYVRLEWVLATGE